MLSSPSFPHSEARSLTTHWYQIGTRCGKGPIGASQTYVKLQGLSLHSPSSAAGVSFSSGLFREYTCGWFETTRFITSWETWRSPLSTDHIGHRARASSSELLLIRTSALKILGLMPLWIHKWSRGDNIIQGWGGESRERRQLGRTQRQIQSRLAGSFLVPVGLNTSETQALEGARICRILARH